MPVSEVFHIQSTYCFNFPQILHKPPLYLILKQYSIMDNVRKVEDTPLNSQEFFYEAAYSRCE